MEYRKQSYEQISEWAKTFGIYAYVCGCKNPDITEEPLCGINWGQHFKKTAEQNPPDMIIKKAGILNKKFLTIQLLKI